ncbi:MAG: PepSY domain-containing protein [Sedimenticola sp.]|nr:PepSY domain-containing protein [Sedimenticola sp.]
MKRIMLLLMLLVPLLSLAESDHERARALHEAGNILSLEQILERVREHYPGRLLEVELEQEGESLIYEVELLDSEGQVWELELDAVSGEMLKQKLEK